MNLDFKKRAALGEILQDAIDKFHSECYDSYADNSKLEERYSELYDCLLKIDGCPSNEDAMLAHYASCWDRFQQILNERGFILTYHKKLD